MNSLSVIERLLDMGAKDYLLSSTLRLLISQRLVRRLCPYCKIPLSFQQICEKFESFKLETHILEPYKNARFYTSSACQHCYMQGYNGRLLIAECLENSSLLQHYIQSPQDKEIITKELQKGGFESMFEAGIKLLAQGQPPLKKFIECVGYERDKGLFNFLSQRFFPTRAKSTLHSTFFHIPKAHLYKRYKYALFANCYYAAISSTAFTHHTAMCDKH